MQALQASLRVAPRVCLQTRKRSLRSSVRAAADVLVDVVPTSVRDVTKGRLVVLGGCVAEPRRVLECRRLRGPGLSTTLSPPVPTLTLRALRHRNGFVGSAVCRAAVAQGLAVTSLSRCGGGASHAPSCACSLSASRPHSSGAPLTPVPGVDYQLGDVFNAETWTGTLSGAAAVVSCVGGFGDNAAMVRINGAANEAAVATAKSAGVPRFVFVSVHQYNLPSFITGNLGYFVGKRAAEKALMSAYGEQGTVLQPGFIFGDRVVGSATIPLGAVGKPLEELLAGPLGKALKPLSALPGSDVLLAPPVSVDAVAAAAVRCATGAHAGGVFDIEAINRIAKE